MDDDKPENGDGPSKPLKKKNQIANSKDSKNSQHQIVVRGDKGIPVLESEDEDGFPISTSDKSKSDSQEAEAEVREEQTQKKPEKANKKKAKDGDHDHAATLKRKVEGADEDRHPEG